MQGLESLIFLALLIAIFYFMLIRPQKRRVEEHKRLVESVGQGDEVVTIGGLYGRVLSVREDEIELDVGGGTRLRFVKSAIARKVPEPGEEEFGEDASEGSEDAGT